MHNQNNGPLKLEKSTANNIITLFGQIQQKYMQNWWYLRRILF